MSWHELLNVLDHISCQVCGDEIMQVSDATRRCDVGRAPFSIHICGFHGCPPARLPISALRLSLSFVSTAEWFARFIHVIHRLGQSRHLVVAFRRLFELLHTVLHAMGIGSSAQAYHWACHPSPGTIEDLSSVSPSLAFCAGGVRRRKREGGTTAMVVVRFSTRFMNFEKFS